MGNYIFSVPKPNFQEEMVVLRDRLWNTYGCVVSQPDMNGVVNVTTTQPCQKFKPKWWPWVTKNVMKFHKSNLKEEVIGLPESDIISITDSALLYHVLNDQLVGKATIRSEEGKYMMVPVSV